MLSKLLEFYLLRALTFKRKLFLLIAIELILVAIFVVFFPFSNNGSLINRVNEYGREEYRLSSCEVREGEIFANVILLRGKGVLIPLKAESSITCQRLVGASSILLFGKYVFAIMGESGSYFYLEDQFAQARKGAFMLFLFCSLMTLAFILKPDGRGRIEGG
jgi:hypothetical protein